MPAPVDDSGGYFLPSSPTISDGDELHLSPTQDYDEEYRHIFARQGPKYKHALDSQQATDESGWSKTGKERRGPWGNLTVLSLDGGGVRGYSTLLILKDLMKKIREEEEFEKPPACTSADSPMVEADRIQPKKPGGSAFLPCHYFDYIAGTSTGGLIAIMLGRLRMDVEKTIDEYIEITSEVYARRWRSRLWLPKYLKMPNKKREAEKLTSKIRSLEPASRGPNKDHTFRSDATRCRTIVCSLQRNADRGSIVPYLFCSYDQEFDRGRDFDKAAHLRIWEVARATSAAPAYFKPFKLGDNKYYDSGSSFNNPSVEVYHEVQLVHERYDASRLYSSVSLFISIGSGNAPLETTPATQSKNLHGMRRSLLLLEKGLSTISEEAHEAMQEMKEGSKALPYFRFNVRSGLENVQFDVSQISTLQLIEKATRAYLEDSNVKSDLEHCAKRLVRLRRQRCVTSRWETFAFGSRYRCRHPDKSCDLQKRDLTVDRDELLDHLRIDHSMPPSDSVHYKDIKLLVEKGRTDSD